MEWKFVLTELPKLELLLLFSRDQFFAEVLHRFGKRFSRNLCVCVEATSGFSGRGTLPIANARS